MGILYYLWNPDGFVEPQASDYADASPTEVPLPDTATFESLKQEPEPSVRRLSLEVDHGDTLGKMLRNQGVPAKQIHEALKPLRKHYSPRKLRPGHRLEIVLARPSDEAMYHDLQELSIRPSLDHEIIVQRLEDGDFEARKNSIHLERQTKYAEVKIHGSLYDLLADKGVPHNIIREMLMVYSFNVDFQRSLKAGDSCKIYYSTYKDPKTGKERSGELVFADLLLGTQHNPVYRYQAPNGDVGYFNEKGESVRKGLLKTPVDGARISSRFSKRRRHPILGYTRAHKGVDFAAPYGSPIMAAGSGVIDRIGWVRGYGRYIRIRHNGEYKTAYAHMSRFKKGLRKGSRVKQGDTIGYIGSSGHATGPHLHYEVLRYGKQINPLTIKMLPTSRLTGNRLIAFKKLMIDVNTNLPGNEKTLA